MPPAAPRKSSPLVAAFRESMEMNYERWRDGAGYDLQLLPTAAPEDLGQIEQLLLSGGLRDWRDAEALAAIDTPRAQEALRCAFDRGDDPMRIAILTYAPKLFSDAERTAAIVSALQNTEIYGGLTQAQLLVETWHPAPVVDALLLGVLERDGATAGSFAAMLLFIHHQATSPYDMEQRPFFLQFQDGDRSSLFHELCDRIGVDAATRRRLLGRARR